MGANADEIRRQLSPLIGLKVSIARRAADMRMLQFGTIRQVPGGSVGEYGLHIQCPWRLEGPSGIITGRNDLWEAANPTDKIDWGVWHYDKDENLQDKRLQELLQGYDEATRSTVNATDDFVVERIDADDFGGATITLTGGYRLSLFPAGSLGEDWRLLSPGNDAPHFVISGGRIEQ